MTNWFKNEESTLEYQDEQQYLQGRREFEDWFNSNEIRGDLNKAIEVLQKSTKIKIESNYNDLENAYFKMGKFDL